MNWIFFDLDDTLWDFSRNSQISLHKLYSESPILRKLFKDPEEFLKVYHIHNHHLWKLYSEGGINTSDLRIERWRRTLGSKQFEVLTAVCEELNRNYLEWLAEVPYVKDGALQVMEDLSRFYLLGIISNGFSETQYNKLKYSGLGKYITRVIVSEEIGISKPDKKLFDYAISETGATEPYIMVGDNPETDILGALKAGWHAIWYNPDDNSFPFSEDQLIKMGINEKLFLGSASTLQAVKDKIFREFNQKG